MDIIESAQETIKEKLKELDKYKDDQTNENNEDRDYHQTQSIIKAVLADKDKNLDRILDQQAQIKMIIDRDGRVMQLKKTISEETKTIDNLRKNCSIINMDALKDRQDLLETQAGEVSMRQKGGRESFPSVDWLIQVLILILDISLQCID